MRVGSVVLGASARPMRAPPLSAAVTLSWMTQRAPPPQPGLGTTYAVSPAPAPQPAPTYAAAPKPAAESVSADSAASEAYSDDFSDELADGIEMLGARGGGSPLLQAARPSTAPSLGASGTAERRQNQRPFKEAMAERSHAQQRHRFASLAVEQDGQHGTTKKPALPLEARGNPLLKPRAATPPSPLAPSGLRRSQRAFPRHDVADPVGMAAERVRQHKFAVQKQREKEAAVRRLERDAQAAEHGFVDGPTEAARRYADYHAEQVRLGRQITENEAEKEAKLEELKYQWKTLPKPTPKTKPAWRDLQEGVDYFAEKQPSPEKPDVGSEEGADAVPSPFASRPLLVEESGGFKPADGEHKPDDAVMQDLDSLQSILQDSLEEARQVAKELAAGGGISGGHAEPESLPRPLEPPQSPPTKGSPHKAAKAAADLPYGKGRRQPVDPDEAMRRTKDRLRQRKKREAEQRQHVPSRSERVKAFEEQLSARRTYTTRKSKIKTAMEATGLKRNLQEQADLMYEAQVLADSQSKGFDSMSWQGDLRAMLDRGDGAVPTHGNGSDGSDSEGPQVVDENEIMSTSQFARHSPATQGRLEYLMRVQNSPASGKKANRSTSSQPGRGLTEESMRMGTVGDLEGVDDEITARVIANQMESEQLLASLPLEGAMHSSSLLVDPAEGVSIGEDGEPAGPGVLTSLETPEDETLRRRVEELEAQVAESKKPKAARQPRRSPANSPTQTKLQKMEAKTERLLKAQSPSRSRNRSAAVGMKEMHENARLIQRSYREHQRNRHRRALRQVEEITNRLKQKGQLNLLQAELSFSASDDDDTVPVSRRELGLRRHEERQRLAHMFVSQAAPEQPSYQETVLRELSSGTKPRFTSADLSLRAESHPARHEMFDDAEMDGMLDDGFQTLSLFNALSGGQMAQPKPAPHSPPVRDSPPSPEGAGAEQYANYMSAPGEADEGDDDPADWTKKMQRSLGQLSPRSWSAALQQQVSSATKPSTALFQGEESDRRAAFFAKANAAAGKAKPPADSDSDSSDSSDEKESSTLEVSEAIRRNAHVDPNDMAAAAAAAAAAASVTVGTASATATATDDYSDSEYSNSFVDSLTSSPVRGQPGAGLAAADVERVAGTDPADRRNPPAVLEQRLTAAIDYMISIQDSENQVNALQQAHSVAAVQQQIMILKQFMQQVSEKATGSAAGESQPQAPATAVTAVEIATAAATAAARAIAATEGLGFGAGGGSGGGSQKTEDQIHKTYEIALRQVAIHVGRGRRAHDTSSSSESSSSSSSDGVPDESSKANPSAKSSLKSRSKSDEVDEEISHEVSHAYSESFEQDSVEDSIEDTVPLEMQKSDVQRSMEAEINESIEGQLSMQKSLGEEDSIPESSLLNSTSGSNKLDRRDRVDPTAAAEQAYDEASFEESEPSEQNNVLVSSSEADTSSSSIGDFDTSSSADPVMKMMSTLASKVRKDEKMQTKTQLLMLEMRQKAAQSKAGAQLAKLRSKPNKKLERQIKLELQVEKANIRAQKTSIQAAELQRVLFLQDTQQQVAALRSAGGRSSADSRPPLSSSDTSPGEAGSSKSSRSSRTGARGNSPDSEARTNEAEKQRFTEKMLAKRDRMRKQAFDNEVEEETFPSRGSSPGTGTHDPLEGRWSEAGINDGIAEDIDGSNGDVLMQSQTSDIVEDLPEVSASADDVPHEVVETPTSAGTNRYDDDSFVEASASAKMSPAKPSQATTSRDEESFNSTTLNEQERTVLRLRAELAARQRSAKQLKTELRQKSPKELEAETEALMTQIAKVDAFITQNTAPMPALTHVEQPPLVARSTSLRISPRTSRTQFKAQVAEEISDYGGNSDYADDAFASESDNVDEDILSMDEISGDVEIATDGSNSGNGSGSRSASDREHSGNNGSLDRGEPPGLDEMLSPAARNAYGAQNDSVEGVGSGSGSGGTIESSIEEIDDNAMAAWASTSAPRWQPQPSVVPPKMRESAGYAAALDKQLVSGGRSADAPSSGYFSEGKSGQSAFSSEDDKEPSQADIAAMTPQKSNSSSKKPVSPLSVAKEKLKQPMEGDWVKLSAGGRSTGCLGVPNDDVGRVIRYSAAAQAYNVEATDERTTWYAVQDLVVAQRGGIKYQGWGLSSGGGGGGALSVDIPAATGATPTGDTPALEGDGLSEEIYTPIGSESISMDMANDLSVGLDGSQEWRGHSDGQESDKSLLDSLSADHSGTHSSPSAGGSGGGGALGTSPVVQKIMSGSRGSLLDSPQRGSSQERVPELQLTPQAQRDRNAASATGFALSPASAQAIMSASSSGSFDFEYAVQREQEFVFEQTGPLGLRLREEPSSNPNKPSPIYLQGVKPGSQSDGVADLRPGMVLTKVRGISIIGMPFEEVLTHLAGRPVQLTFGLSQELQDLDAIEEEEREQERVDAEIEREREQMEREARERREKDKAEKAGRASAAAATAAAEKEGRLAVAARARAQRKKEQQADDVTNAIIEEILHDAAKEAVQSGRR